MQKPFRLFLLWVLFVVAIFISVAPFEYKPDDVLTIAIDQFVAFALLTMFFIIAYPRRFNLICICMLLLPILVEAAQSLVPLRYSAGEDVATKISGALFGLLAGIAWIKAAPVRFALARHRQAARERRKRYGLD